MFFQGWGSDHAKTLIVFIAASGISNIFFFAQNQISLENFPLDSLNVGAQDVTIIILGRIKQSPMF